MSPSSSSSEPSTPDQIYSSSLDSLGLGHALWEPEPNDTGEVQFGDVGFVHEGSFVRLFNLDPSVEEWKVTRWNPAYAPQALPENALKIKRNPHKLASGHYCSHGVYSTEVRGSVSVAAGAPVSAGLEVGYICSAKQGAALRLRSDARAEGIYPSPRLRRYIARHYDQWLAYARDDADHDVKHGDLVVVTSCAKTTPDWATCVFSSRSSGLHVSLAGHAGGVAGVAAGGAHETSVTHTPIQRRGELYHAENRAPGDARGRSDQCVTIKRLKVRKRWFIRLVAAADDHELPSPDDKLSDVGQQTHPVQEGIEIAASENQDTSTDFLDTLLAYELDVSGARVAIAGDDEVEALLNGLSVADFASYLRSAQPRVHVDEDGIASLMMHGLIVHELDQRFSRLDVSAGVTESPVTDIDDWQPMTQHDAGTLHDDRILLGPTQENARTVRYRSLVFAEGDAMRFNNKDCVSLSADGTLLAAAKGARIFVWRLQDNVTLRRLARPGCNERREAISSIAFSPDGHHLVSGAIDCVVLVWDVETGGVVRRLKGHKQPVKYVAFTPHGAQIASYCDDSLRFWDASNGNLIRAFTGLMPEYLGSIVFSPDGSYVATSRLSSGTEMVLFDCRTGARAVLDGDGAKCLAFSPNSGRLASLSRRSRVCVWDTASGGKLVELAEAMDNLSAVAFSPDGSEMAVASYDGTVATYDSRTGERRFTFCVQSARDQETEKVQAVAYSPGSEIIACGADDGCVRLWNSKTGAFVAAFIGQPRGMQVARLVFTPSGLEILSVSHGDDRVVRLWNLRDALRLL